MPAGTLDSLLRPENKDRLTAILTYHVVPGKLLAADVVKQNSLKTVQGGSLRVSVKAGSNVLVDNARLVKTDILCSNGVIHVIDSVVLPQGN